MNKEWTQKCIAFKNFRSFDIIKPVQQENTADASSRNVSIFYVLPTMMLTALYEQRVNTACIAFFKNLDQNLNIIKPVQLDFRAHAFTRSILL